ncbi:putative THAP domain-containing protein 10-like [Apostichopus japonicus]|uniref:Putative THAP domain-containing protein 10-like n=1 Tax=Stichopus japonicus TaxID=307972 RepID=A0A2G8LM39_STIJA|nr:putative THAP domain-containing protein 10-like [Apostichopus japonicus]
MPHRCVVGRCSSTNSKDISCHLWPKDNKTRRLWTRFVQLTRADFHRPTEYSVICSQRFSAECYPASHRLQQQFGLGKRKKVDLIPGSVPTIKYPQNIPESAESASVSDEPSVTSCSGTDNSNTLVIPTQNISDSRYSSSNIPVSSDGRTGSTTVASTVIDTVPAEFIPPMKKVRLSSERQVRKNTEYRENFQY